MHYPHQRLASGYPAYLPQRQHALINPTQTHHIGIAYKRMAGQRQSRDRSIDLKQIGTVTPVAQIDIQTFAQKRDAGAPGRRGKMYRWVIGQLFHHEHGGIHTIRT